MSVVTLTGYRPSARYDSTPWNRARIEGGYTSSGPWSTIETITLSPVEADPTNPILRNFTTDDATDQTWFRVVFLDAANNEELTSPVSSPSGPLTTLTDVRAYLQTPAGDTGQDAVLNTLITRASKAIMEFAQREFAPVATATRTFHYRGGPLHLSPYDLRSVTSIRIDTDGSSPTTLATTDYRLRPKPARDGVYHWVDLIAYPSDFDYRLGGRDVTREVEIAGAWGFPSVPEDVKHWCNVTVNTWLRREVQAFGSEFSSPSDEQLDRPESLPLDVRKGLAHYRIVGAG